MVEKGNYPPAFGFYKKTPGLQKPAPGRNGPACANRNRTVARPFARDRRGSGNFSRDPGTDRSSCGTPDPPHPYPVPAAESGAQPPKSPFKCNKKAQKLQPLFLWASMKKPVKKIEKPAPLKNGQSRRKGNSLQLRPLKRTNTGRLPVSPRQSDGPPGFSRVSWTESGRFPRLSGVSTPTQAALPEPAMRAGKIRPRPEGPRRREI